MSRFDTSDTLKNYKLYNFNKVNLLTVSAWVDLILVMPQKIINVVESWPSSEFSVKFVMVVQLCKYGKRDILRWTEGHIDGQKDT